MEDKKTAIITGATSGIGQAIMKTLTDAGWEVVGLSSADCDLSDLVATAELAERLRDEHTKIDALIHVAGIWHSDSEAFVHRDLEDYDPAWITAIMNVGVTGFMLLTARLLPKIAKDGVVIGISGTFSDVDGGASGWLPYFTSKRALEDFLVGLAQDYPIGPKVYGISPSDTNTEAFATFFPDDAKTAQPPNSISLLVDHLISGDSPYASGDIVAVKDKKAGKGYHV
jgi:NAD(P)-dependent dehydrogenase (short-subunit alcohol dehydrogenase family)